MEKRKLNEQVVNVEEESTEKKGFLDKVKSKLPSKETVIKVAGYTATFVGGIVVGAVGSTLLGNSNDSEEEIEDEDENIEDEDENIEDE